MKVTQISSVEDHAQEAKAYPLLTLGALSKGVPGKARATGLVSGQQRLLVHPASVDLLEPHRLLSAGHPLGMDAGSGAPLLREVL